MSQDKVFLIGAGPGDIELLTLKAVRILKQAEVILVDDLVNPEILQLAGSLAQVVYVGKRCGNRAISQDFINRKIIQLVHQGKKVVRLKGGDPFIFGRGGEEMLALDKAGIVVEVIPGITAAMGIAASLGIPLTHRGLSLGVTLVTGHTQNGSNFSWKALAKSGTTLVIYMGMSDLTEIVSQLLKAGMSPLTPAVAVRDATCVTEKQLFFTLGTVPDQAEIMKFGKPASVIVGEVVMLARRKRAIKGVTRVA